MENKNAIIVLGASKNPAKSSYLASKLLLNKGYDVLAYGKNKGNIEQLKITDKIPNGTQKKVDVISIFLKPKQQKQYYNFILSSNPTSLIFNPGSENEELEQLAKKLDINIITCCTLALGSVGIL